jgi:hypothetical protein
MRAAQSNEPKGKRYEKIMGEWLLAHSFHVINKGTRNRLLECLQHRRAIEKWRATLTEGERFRFNHPDTVLRKWKAVTVAPEPNAASKTSAAANVELQEKLYRAERELSLGGDLWAPEDAPEEIATVMLVKLSPTKAERVARAILNKVKDNSDPSVSRREPSAEAKVDSQPEMHPEPSPTALVWTERKAKVEGGCFVVIAKRRRWRGSRQFSYRAGFRPDDNPTRTHILAADLKTPELAQAAAEGVFARGLHVKAMRKRLSAVKPRSCRERAE